MLVNYGWWAVVNITFPFCLTFLHVPEWRVAEAVGAQGVALSPRPWSPQHKLKVIQWTPELLVKLDGSILGKTVGLVTVRAVESAGLGLHAHVCFISFKNHSLPLMGSYTFDHKVAKGHFRSISSSSLKTHIYVFAASCLAIIYMSPLQSCVEHTDQVLNDSSV